MTVNVTDGTLSSEALEREAEGDKPEDLKILILLDLEPVIEDYSGPSGLHLQSGAPADPTGPWSPSCYLVDLHAQIRRFS